MAEYPSLDDLFVRFFQARSEKELDTTVQALSKGQNVSWHPLGGNDSNFGVIENQQSNPVAASVEKLTNAIDAILMRRCLEESIDPKAQEAPQSIEEAVERFFPNHKNWDLNAWRNQQAENIQIIGNGYRGKSADTSLIIYDDGEGQHPEDFENTFLSLLRGNKNEIHFVHGKYNMGGSGAIAFCGKNRYQLIASKRYDGSGLFGFTLIRKHPLTREEAQTKRSTWYEYLKIDGEIPAFEIDELDLGLYNRKFRTGTIIKLYSYEVKGNKHVRRDLARSINEFLYEPALPIYTVETKERYPNDNVLEGVIFGLKRRLENNEYIEETFSEEYTDRNIGKMKVTVHVFKARAKEKTVSDTRKTIQNEYFKNNMAVLFSVNGQVHGHYTSEFITRSLKFNLLRDYLLIHVDCTDMHIDFRNELFMASRDRLKQGEESKALRHFLADNLKKGQLRDAYKRRKDNISVNSADDTDMLKTLAENLPINDEMRKLLSRTFKLDQADKTKKSKPSLKNGTRKKGQPEKPPFKPQRYPSFFNINTKKRGNTHVFTVPINGERTVQFNSDVENQYFDRVDDPGDLQIAILDYIPNTATGGTAKGTVNNISDVLNVIKRSPHNGTIKVVFHPTDNVQVGDEIQVSVSLTSPGEDFNHILLIKISEPKSQPKKVDPKPVEEPIGLPKLVQVFETVKNDPKAFTWEKLAGNNIDMNYDVIMYPLVEGDILEAIYINMDSNVLKSYKSKLRSMEQHQVAERRYISAVYFHTLFLYVINKRRGYHIFRWENEEQERSVDLTEYLQDMFSSHYAAFLMNFGTGELVEALG